MKEATGRIVAFGEIMFRLSPPGRELLMQTPRLDTWLAGAEANVAGTLAGLGHDVAMVSTLPPGPLGEAAIAALRARGVDCRAILRRAGRMGLYYVVAGAGRRATEVIYDRLPSAFSDTPPDGWDWPALLAGAGRLHLSGITPALGPNGTRAAIAAAEAAQAAGVPISFDGNYRARLWEAWDSDPRRTLTTLVGKADILFGNHRDIALLLGPDAVAPVAGTDPQRAAALAALDAFPRLQCVASTARTIEHVGQHRLSARIDGRDDWAVAPEALVAEIVDRIGTGDAFAAGVLHGLSRGGGDLRHAVEQGLALTVLKHSLPGDACLFGQADIDMALDGELDVRR